MDVVIAALLHDVIEDTTANYEDVAVNFGRRVAEIVRENSDDMSLPKADRRRARIAAMPLKSREARLVKMADVTSNLRAIAVSPPAGWTAELKLGYLQGCRHLVDAGRGTDVAIERIFDQTAADVERPIRDEVPFSIEGREVAVRHLENAIGQAVHLVYLLNTENGAFGETEVDRLCELIGLSFPSARVQPAEAIYERQRWSILMVRIRTDSKDAVVDLAQRLWVAFGWRSEDGTFESKETTPSNSPYQFP